MDDAVHRHHYFWHITKVEKIALGLAACALLIGVGFELSDSPSFEQYKGWLLASWGALILYLVIPSLMRCGSTGIKSVWSVVKGSVLLLALTLVIFYTSYYWIVAALPQAAIPPSDKVLNFPPMIAALWAAGMGWYVHYQATAKNHRTTNSFNLVMQTRTSKEFLERAALVQRFYPHGSDVPVADRALFLPSALRDSLHRRQAEEVVGECSEETALQIQKAEAANAMKYLLNYYEFMSVGVAVNDLGEDLLYETLGVTVTSMFNRGQPFIHYCRAADCGNQSLAFDELEKLATRWSARLADEIHKLRNPK